MKLTLKGKIRTTLEDTITLTEKVVVSDPSYELGTWCSGILDGVLEGKYIIDYFKAEDRWDGHTMVLTHESMAFDDIGLPTIKLPMDIGMDGGMVAIAPFAVWKSDDNVPEGLEINYGWEPKWFTSLIPLDSLGLSYRVVNDVLCSSSGYGDGAASLFVRRTRRQEIYQIMVRF